MHIINEDDMAQDRGESAQQYHERLLRQITNGNFASMDHHDRLHGAIAFLESLKKDATYKGKSIPPLIVRIKSKSSGSRHAYGMRVTGIGGKPHKATIVGVPASAGGHRSYHGGEDNLETNDARHITGIMMSNYAFMRPEHINTLQRLIDFRGLREMFEPLKQLLAEAKKEKKPYKGFKKGKNHPEGGLSRAEARRQGIHAGIETKQEAKRKGGFGKLSGKTQKRRKSFCARMCGMKRRRTSAKTARDPKSKINAALRVWGCKCGRKSRTQVKEEFIAMILEKKDPCWKGYEMVGMKKKGGRRVPNCVPKNESLNFIQRKVKDKFLAEGCGCGGGKAKPKPKPVQRPKAINEEVVNADHKGKMTSGMIKKRDKRAKKLKGKVKVVRQGDTPLNAQYRLATYIEWLKKGGKKKKKGGKEKQRVD